MSEKIATELILDEIRNSKQELKSAIEAVEGRILLKIKETNTRLNEIQQQCDLLSATTERLEIKEKANNIVIFGLQKSSNEITLELIISEVQRYLNIKLEASDINNFYPLGKYENCPVKLELVSYLKKVDIFKNVKKLKGTNISIANDMTIKQRGETKILRRHLYIGKQNKDNTCYIKKNKLFINNKAYTPQELENLDDTQLQPNSTQGAPTISVPNILPSSHKLLQTTQKELPLHKKKETAEPTTKLATEIIREDKIATRSKNIKH